MEIWEMTLAEYVQKQEKYGRWAAPESFKDEAWVSGWRGNQKIGHRNSVRRALKNGEPVPEIVLQDYPNLKQAATPEPETEQPEEIFIARGKCTAKKMRSLPDPPQGYEKAYLCSGGSRGKGYYYVKLGA